MVTTPVDGSSFCAILIILWSRALSLYRIRQAGPPTARWRSMVVSHTQPERGPEWPDRCGARPLRRGNGPRGKEIHKESVERVPCDRAEYVCYEAFDTEGDGVSAVGRPEQRGPGGGPVDAREYDFSWDPAF